MISTLTYGVNMEQLRKICINCSDYDEEERVCTIRNVILKDKTREPMPRPPKARGCEVFLSKY